jgi:hypothetical protein
VTDEHQTSEELQSHYGPGGPVAAAHAFTTAVFERRDLREAWRLVDPDFRLVLAQAWLWANRTHPIVLPHDREEAAEALAEAQPSHELWDAFEATQLDELDENYPDFDHTTWGAARRPRPVAPDMEIVLSLDTGGEVITVETPTLVERGLMLLMRHVGAR